MRMPYSNLIIVAILSLLLPSSVIFTAMGPSSLISNQIESLFADDKDKINFFLANINDGSRNVLLEQASAQESESDVAEEEEEQPEEEDVAEEEEEEEELAELEEEGEEEDVAEEEVVAEEELAELEEDEDVAEEEDEDVAEEESSTDAQEEEENVPSSPPQENIGNKTVESPRNQSIPTPIPINNSNSTNATTTVPINNNTNTTGLNGTLGNPITFSKTFPLKGTSGLDMKITITPIINGPELSGVTNVRKESDGPANPPLYQEFSYYMPFSMLPSEHQQQILAANPGTVAQGSSSSPSSSPSPSPSPSTYNRQTAEGVTPALLTTTTTTEEDSGGGQLREGNKDNDSYDIVPVQSLKGLTNDKMIKAVKVLVVKGFNAVTNIQDVLGALNLLDAYGAHLKEMERIQGCLNNLPDSELTGAGNTRQERQQYIDVAVENMKSMYKNKALHLAGTAAVGFVPIVGDLVAIAYMATDIQKWIEYEWDSNIENALAIARDAARCKDFPTSMTILGSVTISVGPFAETTGVGVAKLQFPKVGPEATAVRGTGNYEGTLTDAIEIGDCAYRGKASITGDGIAELQKTGPSGNMQLLLRFDSLSPETMTISGRGNPDKCPPGIDVVTFAAVIIGNEGIGEILPPRKQSYELASSIITWEIVSVDY